MRYLFCLFLVFIANIVTLNSQKFSIVHVEGDAFVYGNNGDKKSYSKLVFGPISGFEKIVIKDKAVVRIKKDDNKICDLSKEGTYSMSDLQFKEVDDNSVFGKFCKYFESFFTNHSSSESKNNYKNSIYAISRGVTPPPSLDFPLSGDLPIDAGALPFIWTHACDTCEYIFAVHDFSSREVIYTVMTKEKKIEIESPQKYLKPGHQYYWSVKIAGKDLEYENIEFTSVANGTYQTLLADINREADGSPIPLKGLSKTLFILSELENKSQPNFAILFSFQALKSRPNDTRLADIIDRYWYDQLMAK